MEAEGLGVDKGDVMGVERTGQAGQGRGQGKDDDFIGRGVDPHDLGGDLMVPDGPQGPAVIGIHQAVGDGQDQDDGNDGQDQDRARASGSSGRKRLGGGIPGRPSGPPVISRLRKTRSTITPKPRVTMAR